MRNIQKTRCRERSIHIEGTVQTYIPIHPVHSCCHRSNNTHISTYINMCACVSYENLALTSELKLRYTALTASLLPAGHSWPWQL